MHVTLLTPEGKQFEGEAESILLPALDGKMGILENHAPVISALGEGTLELRLEKSLITYKINSGLIEVQNNQINILSDSAVRN
jgi:F-type H+-transporting ATPase subunit epsilon